ncbi:E3 ubiquitin-protein ligase MARCH4 [Delphinapterus leucas]|uniref:RING-type E3 ubiquitin transferase n=1 Tax=Delphinapterus leucas TaxID=9749 RepID=A0A2Y9MPT2_DELLE|nr:E3 ubiquitin-protein ligase MARCH4 [Delphinapterus leucas]
MAMVMLGIWRPGLPASVWGLPTKPVVWPAPRREGLGGKPALRRPDPQRHPPTVGLGPHHPPPLSLQGELLSPCRCDGSVKCTHQPCLIKWISERGCWSCELCYYKYHVIAISTKNPLQWQAISLTVIEKVQIAAAILGSLFLIASISWLIWSTFSPSAKWQRQDLLFQICYGMYGFMDVVCIGLIIHEGPSVYRIFKRWQAVNQQWKVLNYDKTKDLEDQKAGGRTNARMSSSTQANAPPSGEEAVGTPAPEEGPARAASHPSGPLSDHHCAYTILHILSHLRPHEQRTPQGGSRELVMRVTTV